MNANLFISMPIAAGVSSVPVSSKPAAKTASTAVGSDHLTNTDHAAHADNTKPVAQKAKPEKPSESFNKTLEKKMATEEPDDVQTSQTDEETQHQYQTLETVPEMECPADPLAAQAPVALPSEPVAPEADRQQLAGKPEINLSQIPEAQLEKIENPENHVMMQQSEKFVIDADQKPDNTQNNQDLLQQTITADPALITTDENSTTAQQPLITDNPVITASKEQLVSDNPVNDAKLLVTDSSNIPLATETTAVTSEITQNPNQQSPQNEQGKQNREESAPPIPVGENNITLDDDQLLNLKPNVSADQKDSRGNAELLSLPQKDFSQDELTSPAIGVNKASQEQPHASAASVENINNLISNQTPGNDTEPALQIVSPSIAQADTVEQSSPLDASGKAFVHANLTAGPGQQIQESIQSSYRPGGQQLVVRLDPVELGKVVIKFSEQGGDVTGVLQVDKSQTRDHIQQELPGIIQNLQNAGIGIKRIEVVLTNQQEYSAKDQSSTAGQDSAFGQQSSANPESQSNNAAYGKWLTNADYNSDPDEQNMVFTDDSINMLV